MATASASHLTIRDGAVRHPDPRVAEPPPPGARVHIDLPQATGRALMTAPVNLGVAEPRRSRRRRPTAPAPPVGLPSGWRLVELHLASGASTWHLELPAEQAEAATAFLARVGGAA